jgi:transposase-like protein
MGKLVFLWENTMSKQKRTRRRFTAEFKAETVKLVKQSDRTMADIAMALGISAKSIGEWVRLSEESGDSISEDERIGGRTPSESPGRSLLASD